MECNDCPKHYIGQTDRLFKTRLKEHIPNRNYKSTFADQQVESGTSLEWIKISRFYNFQKGNQNECKGLFRK